MELREEKVRENKLVEEKSASSRKSYKKVILAVVLVLIIARAYDTYSKYGGVFIDSPTDAKLKSYCEEFIEKYYPQNSDIKFGTVYKTENNTRKVQVFIKTENILTITEEVHFEFEKSGKILDIYQMQEVSPFFERIKLVPFSIMTFNSENFDE